MLYPDNRLEVFSLRTPSKSTYSQSVNKKSGLRKALCQYIGYYAKCCEGMHELADGPLFADGCTSFFNQQWQKGALCTVRKCPACTKLHKKQQLAKRIQQDVDSTPPQPDMHRRKPHASMSPAELASKYHATQVELRGAK